jgi:hypothetical protein
MLTFHRDFALDRADATTHYSLMVGEAAFL